MSDNRRRYSSIRKSLSQMLSNEPKGFNAKQLNILAGLISGIVGSRRTNYPQIASKVPDRAKPESRVKRISRFVNEADEKNDQIRYKFAYRAYISSDKMTRLWKCYSHFTRINDGS